MFGIGIEELPLFFALQGVALYAVLAGADFGAGIWQLLAGRGERARRIREHAHHSMAPVWEANHVWLIFVLVVVWTGYPVAFASMASTLAVALTAAGVGINLQVSSNVVLAELSWTDAEQTQAINRVHRIGQDQPVTAWRIIAAQTIDARIAELIDDKAGLAARALDGSDEELSSSVHVQLEALVALLTDALVERDRSGV